MGSQYWPERNSGNVWPNPSFDTYLTQRMKTTVEMVDPPMLGWSGKVIGKDGTVIIQFGGDEYGWMGPWTVNHQIQGTYQDVEFTILFVKNNLDSIISPPFNWS